MGIGFPALLALRCSGDCLGKELIPLFFSAELLNVYCTISALTHTRENGRASNWDCIATSKKSRKKGMGSEKPILYYIA